MGVFYLNESAPEFQDQKKKYKLGSRLPHLRFYKNNLFGEEKNEKSFEIFINEKLDAIIDEVHEGIDHDVRETSEKIMMNVASSYALEEKKTVVFYIYESGRVSIHLKALSGLSILKDDFVFISVTSPSDDMMKQFQIQKIPTIVGILPPTPDAPDSIPQFMYGGSINFDEILANLLKLSGKEEYQQRGRRRGPDRKFEEITSTEKFRQNCLEKQKGCAIAFLSGN